MRITLLDSSKQVAVLGQTLNASNPSIVVDKVALLNTTRLSGPGTSSDVEDLKRHFQSGLIRIVDDGHTIASFSELVGVVQDGDASAFVSVANLAALTACPVAQYANGTQAYVESLKARFTLDKTSALASDGITIIATSSTGRWIRILLPDQRWAAQGTWYIDGTNGNDENSGLTSGAALKTYAEWKRRVGQLPLPATTVNILTSLGATDYMDLDFRQVPGTLIQFVGTITQLATGTLTGVVARNPSANQALEIVDAARTWTTFIGKLVHLTVSDSYLWLGKDLGANAARVTGSTVFGAHPTADTEYTVLGNEAYEILELPSVNMQLGSLIMNEERSGVAPFIVFRNLKVTGTAGGASAGVHFECLGHRTSFKCCHISGVKFTGPVSFESCNLTSCKLNPGNGTAYLVGCLISGGFVSIYGLGSYSWRQVGILAQGAYVQANLMSFSISTSVGIFDVPTGGAFAASVWGGITFVNSGGYIYGSGNQIGANLYPGTKIISSDFARLTVTGSTRELANWQNGALSNQLPDLVASAGAVLPAAAPCNTWAAVKAAPFNGKVFSYNEGWYLGP